MTPHDYVRAVIAQWEGNLSMDPNDHGNWHNGQLLGSMHGVTGDTLAQYLHREVTAADVASVTLDEAADIAVHAFYEPYLATLDWSPAVAELLDFEWTAGPSQTVKNLQRLCGAPADGQMGPTTRGMWNHWAQVKGTNGARIAVYQMRVDYYNMLARNPEYAQYRQGWLNRTAWAANVWPGL